MNLTKKLRIAMMVFVFSSIGYANAQSYNASQNINASKVSVTDSNGNTVQLKDAVGQCQQSTPNVFYGAVNSSSQMGVASNTEHLRASGNVLPYFNIVSINATVNGGGGGTSDVSGPIGMSGFQNVLKTTGTNGVVELMYSKFMTPDIDTKYDQNLLTTDGSEAIDDKQLLAQSGFKPTVATLNVRRDVDVGVVANDDDTLFTDHDVENFNTALADIKANAPSIQQVWPFINGNASHNFDPSDSWWANGIKIIKTAGGVGLDIPAGVFVANGPSSIDGLVAQIKWANANGIKTLALLSPYSEKTPAGYGSSVYPQWRYDEEFLYHVKMIISWLTAEGAAPTAYAVVNYSPIQYYNPVNGSFGSNCSVCERITGNLIGSDTDSVNQTVSYVARWVAENAPTSTYTSMPDMGTSSTQTCSSTVLGGYKTTKPVIGSAQIGVGSLAYQDYNHARLVYPSLYGAELRNTVNMLGNGNITFGAGSLSQPASIAFDSKNGGLTFSNQPVYIDGFNLNLINKSSIMVENGNVSFTTGGTNGIQFQTADGSKSSWIIGDGSGGIRLGSQIDLSYGGDVIVSNDIIEDSNILFQSRGVNGIEFMNKDNSVGTWIYGDTSGGINIGDAINVNSATTPGVTTFKGDVVSASTFHLNGGHNGFEFCNSDVTTCSFLTGDGSGGILIGSGIDLSGAALNFTATDIHSTGNILLTNGNNGIGFYTLDGTKSSWIVGDSAGGMLIGNGISEDNSGSVTFNYGAGFSQNVFFKSLGTNGINFETADGSKSSWLNGDGNGGINLGYALNISPGSTGTATFKNGWALADSTGTQQAIVSLDSSGNTTITSKNGGGTINVNADTFKVTNGNVDFDSSQIVSDSTGNLGVQSLRLGGVQSPQYLAAPSNGAQGLIIHGKDNYHTINLGYDINDAAGNLSNNPNTESHLLWGNSASSSFWNGWQSNGSTLSQIWQLNRGNSFINTNSFHIGRWDVATGANLNFHSNGDTTATGVIAVHNGNTNTGSGDFAFYGNSFSFRAPVTTTGTIAQSDNSNTLVTSSWVRGLISSVAYANLPSSPYNWQEVICTDCYVSNSSNTGVRGMYNPTRKAWTDLLGNTLVH